MDSNPFDLVVRNGTAVAHDRVFRADIGIRGGSIAAVGLDLSEGIHEFDAFGLHVLPGLVDAHVHLREPGMTYKGGFADGTRAAAVGGVTTLIDMPNTTPPVTDAVRLAEKRQLVQPKAHVDFGLYGLFSGDNADQFAALAAAGCAGLKLYLGKSVGENPAPDDGAIYAGLEAARDAGLVVGVHAENDSIVELFSARLRNANRIDPASHSEARPEIAEVEAITRIITVASEVGASIHIHHLSSGAGLERIELLKRGGHHVSVEAVIAHLLLDEAAYDAFGNLVKLNPPLRLHEDRKRLWQGIGNGEIDIVATDHAPHTAEEQSEENVWDAHGGFIGVETLLPLMLTQVAAGRLTISDVVRLCAYNPARRWALTTKGHLTPGADADLAIVDLTAAGRIDASTLHSLSTATPFDGWPTRGRVERTYLRGELIAAGGEPIGSPRGRFVAPTRSHLVTVPVSA